MAILVTSKYEEDPIKIEGARVAIQDIIVVLLTCKNEGDHNKNEGVRVATTLNIHFQTLKGS